MKNNGPMTDREQRKHRGSRGGNWVQRVIESEVTLRGIGDALREISELALSSLRRTEESASSIRVSQEVSEDLYELVNRFRQ